MEYVIKHNKHNLFIAPNGIDTIGDEKRARHFLSEQRATNFMKNLGSRKRKDYSVLAVEPVVIKVKKEKIQSVVAKSKETKIDDSVSSFINALSTFTEEQEKRKEILAKALSQCDMELADFYHFVLIEKADAVKRAKMWKIYKSLLQKRSDIKNERLKISIVEDCMKQEHFSRDALFRRLEGASPSNLRYTPRTSLYTTLQSL